MKSFCRLLLLTILVCFTDTVYGLTGPLSTDGGQIVTEEGEKVRLQGVSWFGFETEAFAPQGLGIRSYQSMMDQMKEMGFNTLRLPFSSQMFDAESVVMGIDGELNPDLIGLTSIEILDKIVNYAATIGLAVILDHHRHEAGEGAVRSGLWYTEEYSAERFAADWENLARRYQDNPAVIGADLHNEPHGEATWGSGDEATDWKAAAEATGNRILAINPDWLIIVQGIETYQEETYWSGSNLLGVKNDPVILNEPTKLVYSAHDYPKSIFNQPWFDDLNYPYNLPDFFRNFWGYIVETDTTPVLLGQFGGKSREVEDDQWMETLTAYMNGDFAGTGTSQLSEEQQGVSWIWWAWNPNQGGPGGILLDDWQTPDEANVPLLKPLMTSPDDMDLSE